MVILSSKIICPVCGSECNTKNYDIMWAESEIHCPKHGHIGERDHDDGWNMWDDTKINEIKESEKK